MTNHLYVNLDQTCIIFALPVGRRVAELEMYLFVCKVSTP